jgi:hypothetical protein
MYYRR